MTDKQFKRQCRQWNRDRARERNPVFYTLIECAIATPFITLAFLWFSS